jgi:hypothetical protein
MNYNKSCNDNKNIDIIFRNFIENSETGKIRTTLTTQRRGNRERPAENLDKLPVFLLTPEPTKSLPGRSPRSPTG